MPDSPTAAAGGMLEKLADAGLRPSWHALGPRADRARRRSPQLAGTGLPGGTPVARPEHTREPGLLGRAPIRALLRAAVRGCPASSSGERVCRRPAGLVDVDGRSRWATRPEPRRRPGGRSGAGPLRRDAGRAVLGDGGRAIRPGSVDAAPIDLGRMMLVGYATVYGNDWFVAAGPPAGGDFSRVSGFDVLDVLRPADRAHPGGADQDGVEPVRAHPAGAAAGARSGTAYQPVVLAGPSLPASLESSPPMW